MAMFRWMRQWLYPISALLRWFLERFRRLLDWIWRWRPRPPGPDVNWPVYGADRANSKFSPVDDVTAANFNSLREAWRCPSPDNAVRDAHPQAYPFVNESTPIMVDGKLYSSTGLNQVVCIDAATGRLEWSVDLRVYEEPFPPPVHGFVNRGLAYWRNPLDPAALRLYIGTGNAYLYCINAGSRLPDPRFGDRGRVDLMAGLRGGPFERRWLGVSSPPIVVGNTVIVGSAVYDFPRTWPMPPGQVRAYNGVTGNLLWTFDTIPQTPAGPIETWEGESWRTAGACNVWSIMSADESLGHVYVPTSTPANDFYGGGRPGANVYAESLVCLNADDGKVVWAQQLVHHGLWDYDSPAAPNLLEITGKDGRRVRAVAQVTKQGFIYAFDRETGEPIWDLPEVSVDLPSDIPGESAFPTQRIPSWPPPFEIQGCADDSNVWDITPEVRAEAIAAMNRHRRGPLFTPPSLWDPATQTGGTLTVPGAAGGGSWSGAAVEPGTGRLYVTSRTRPVVLGILPNLVDPADPTSGPLLPIPDAYYGRFFQPNNPTGVPLFRPPFGRLVAYDMNTGSFAWPEPAPVGTGNITDGRWRDRLAPGTRLGWPLRSFAVVTPTLVTVAMEGRRAAPSEGAREEMSDVEPAFYAYDKASGRLVGRVPMPMNAWGSHITYRVGGKQYFVFPYGGLNRDAGWLALALPD